MGTAFPFLINKPLSSPAPQASLATASILVCTTLMVMCVSGVMPVSGCGGQPKDGVQEGQCEHGQVYRHRSLVALPPPQLCRRDGEVFIFDFDVSCAAPARLYLAYNKIACTLCGAGTAVPCPEPIRMAVPCVV